MIHDIEGYESYQYDDQEKVVLSTYRKVEKLKWLTLNGRRRVTLRKNKTPHWLFEGQVLRLANLQLPGLEKIEKVKNKDGFEIVRGGKGFTGKSKKQKEEVIISKRVEKMDESKININLQKWGEVEKFLKDRQKPLRRDQFQNKFGTEFLEECIKGDLLEESKIGSFKFYNLKK